MRERESEGGKRREREGGGQSQKEKEREERSALTACQARAGSWSSVRRELLKPPTSSPQRSSMFLNVPRGVKSRGTVFTF